MFGVATSDVAGLVADDADDPVDAALSFPEHPVSDSVNEERQSTATPNDRPRTLLRVEGEAVLRVEGEEGRNKIRIVMGKAYLSEIAKGPHRGGGPSPDYYVS